MAYSGGTHEDEAQAYCSIMQTGYCRFGGAALFTGNGELIFPSTKNRTRPISIELLTVVRRATGFTRAELHVHGLRAMASTILNEKGYNRDWIERQLSLDDKNRIRATYNYAEYLPQRHEMMQAWADYLDSLRSGICS